MSADVRTILASRVTHLEIVCIWWSASHPYKRVPTYTRPAEELYIGQGRNKCGTHIFAIAVEAYQNVMQTNTNHSILITGKAGADRTKKHQ